jgi:hypothetical protein
MPSAPDQSHEARSMLAGAAVSAVAAVALGVAATGSVANVLAVFGVWAAISGAAQLVSPSWPDPGASANTTQRATIPHAAQTEVDT